MNRLWTATLLACVALVSSAWAEGEQWKSVDLSMAELVSNGYDLITVVPSGRDQIFFLKSHAKLAKCRESTTVNLASLPPPPSLPPHRDSSVMTMVDMPVPEITTNMECFELVRPK
jgi:hypothetical protein